MDYLEIFSFQSPIKNYTQISPIKAALIQADRQTDKYEANLASLRLCKRK